MSTATQHHHPAFARAAALLSAANPRPRLLVLSPDWTLVRGELASPAGVTAASVYPDAAAVLAAAHAAGVALALLGTTSFSSSSPPPLADVLGADLAALVRHARFLAVEASAGEVEGEEEDGPSVSADTRWPAPAPMATARTASASLPAPREAALLEALADLRAEAGVSLSEALFFDDGAGAFSVAAAARLGLTCRVVGGHEGLGVADLEAALADFALNAAAGRGW
jgi:hypothetical protein